MDTANIPTTTWREPWIMKFRDLMPFIVHEILLVSSAYDAFILEEDGPLTERLFQEYAEHTLFLTCPRIIRANNTQEAMEILAQRHIDLVITTPRLEGLDVNGFGRLVKDKYPYMPTVLLAFDESDLRFIETSIDKTSIDQYFLWSGDTRILFAIIKNVEDRKNVHHDTQIGVGVIVLVEDSVRDYSSTLELLYAEILRQSKKVITSAPNAFHKMLRLRSRPKVLLAKNYEEAVHFCDMFSNNLIGVVSDIRMPKANVCDAQAGFALFQWVQEQNGNIPILLQSSEEANDSKAKQLHIRFVNKHAKDQPEQIKKFLKDNLGFGNFVFRLPNRKIIAEVQNLGEMEKTLKKIDMASFEYHSSRNDFSTWLRTRSMFVLAAKVKATSFKQFESMEDARKFLVAIMHQATLQEKSGGIVDFSSRETVQDNRFIRLGSGSTGGKGRGIAYINSILANESVLTSKDTLDILIPKTVVIGTSIFDKFMEKNHLYSKMRKLELDEDIQDIFLNGRLSSSFLKDLRVVTQELHGPLAIRSSGLLEDSHFLPFAGIYQTFFLPNSHPDPEVRFQEIRNAIKSVYASTFSSHARCYMHNTPYQTEKEKMAVIIQQVVGRQFNDRFYPHFSGVAMSYNYYPIASQKPEDGIAMVALGLGQTIVEGSRALRFCPASPGILPQFSSPADVLKNSQSSFYAIDMSLGDQPIPKDLDTFMRKYTLDVAEDDKTLMHIGSVYSAADDVIRENFTNPGPRVVTFNNILKWNSLPLAETIKKLLQVTKSAMGCAVEIEFAVDIGADKSSLYVLQVRPMTTDHLMQSTVNLDDIDAEEVFCRSQRAMGHGIIEGIKDILYVKPQNLDFNTSKLIAQEIGLHSQKLHQNNIPFMLIGPGRWGSQDPHLGIPVKWAQISGVRVIVETGLKDRSVDPSDGTHFFQNLTALKIGYLTLPPIDVYSQMGSLDWDWLKLQNIKNETQYLCHVELETPLTTYLDGTQGQGVILKTPQE